jgi:flagellar biosynthesis/type III secretory pathway chaperone
MMDAPSTSSWAEPGAAVLAEALTDEARLLEDLVQVLRQQRDGVAQDQLSVVDETIYSAQRIFRTLAQARRRRRGLLQAVAGSGDVPLRELDASMGPRMTPDLRQAANTLHEKALELSSELEVNRRVLSGAIRSGEDLIMALCGGKREAPSGYGPTPAVKDPPSESGIIINRQI